MSFGESFASRRACSTGLAATLDQIVDQPLEFRPRHVHLQVLGTRGVGRDEGQVDVGRRLLRKFFLGLFRGFAQTLQRHRIAAQVDAVFVLELVGDEIDQPLVEVVAAEVGVAIRGKDFDHLVPDFEDRNVKRAAAQVEDAESSPLFSSPSRKPGPRRSAH